MTEFIRDAIRSKLSELEKSNEGRFKVKPEVSYDTLNIKIPV